MSSIPPFDLPVTGEDRLVASALTGARTDREITRAAQHVRHHVNAETSKLRSLLQSMLDVAENADETGYVTDVGFVDLDKLHEEVRGALENNKPAGDRE